MARARLTLAALSLALVAASARDARAEATRDPVAAEALFAEARALIREGRWEAACPKLETSQSLDPAVGTLLNLGECYAHVGKSASAWLRYREAAAMALRQGQREREAVARERASRLEPKLCHLTIEPEDGSTPDDIVVRRDGFVLDRGAWGVPIPTDEGAHEISASGAGGREPFSQRVTLGAVDAKGRCAPAIVRLPRFSPSPAPVGGGTSAAALHERPGALETPPPRERTAPSWGAHHTLAVVAAGVGLVAGGAATVFALDASAKKARADAGCTDAGCTPEARQANLDAGRSADFATVAVATSAVFLAGAAVLWITAPSLRATTAARGHGLAVVF